MSKRLAQKRPTSEWQELDARHHLHPFSEHADLAAKGARVITHADGIYLYDINGNRLLDGMAGLWCVQIGYGNEELAEAGYEALKELPYYNLFFQTTHPYAAELARAVAELTPPGLDRIFFGSSGSDANDTAIKLIRYYWNLKGQPQRKQIISRDKGYHGVTMGAASLSGLTPMHPQSDLPLPGFHHIPCPYWFGEGGDMDPDDFGRARAEELEKKILELGPENVAAFVAEPVQGAGGMIIPPASYWPAIQEICRKYDILLHADEVICGFGRTGNWFGSQTLGIEPDLMTMAKGITSGYQPLSAIALGPRMGDVLFEAGEEWSHGFTYSGHPVACAVALKNIEIMKRTGLVDRVRETTAPYFANALATLADHPLVGEVRTIGLLGAIELVNDKAARTRFEPEGAAGTRCRDHCFANGLVMRAVRDTMILSPPLILTEDDIDELVVLARKCLDLTAADLGVS